MEKTVIEWAKNYKNKFFSDETSFDELRKLLSKIISDIIYKQYKNEAISLINEETKKLFNKGYDAMLIEISLFS